MHRMRGREWDGEGEGEEYVSDGDCRPITQVVVVPKVVLCPQL